MTDKDGGSKAEGQAGYAEDLEAAMASMEAAEAEKAEGEETEGSSAPVKDGGGREHDPETGKFVAKDKSEADKGEEVDASGDEGAGVEVIEQEGYTPQPEQVEAPEHWSQEDKDEFANLSEELKPLWLKKAKSLESGYNRKFEEVATERKQLETFKGFNEIFEPYEQQLQMHGLTPEAYTRRLVAIGQQLQANPAETIHWLAQQYGVDLGTPAEAGTEGDDAEYHPAFSKLKAELQDLKNTLQASHQEQYQATQAQNEGEWTRFVEAKDGDGNPLYPHADKVRVSMGQELLGNPEKPGETTQDALKRAYEAASWKDPELRKPLVEAQVQAAQAEQQRKADLHKAKSAGRTVKPKSNPATDTRPAPKETWKEELDSNWEQLSQ